MSAHGENDHRALAKFVRPYVTYDRAPEAPLYVDLAARMDWREFGHHTAARAKPDRYLIGRPRPSTVGSAVVHHADLLPVEAPAPRGRHHRPEPGGVR